MRHFSIKLLIFIFSLFFFLFILEMGMRLTGKLITIKRGIETISRPWDSSRRNKDEINILTLGDSFTFGGYVKASQTYPAYLEKYLNEQSPHYFKVANAGVCEYTSRDLLNHLESVLTFNKPDIVILLVGAANLFDPKPYYEELQQVDLLANKGFKRLRIYKMARHIYQKLSFLLDSVKPSSTSAIVYNEADLREVGIDNLDIYNLNSTQLQEFFQKSREKIQADPQNDQSQIPFLVASCLLDKPNIQLCEQLEHYLDKYSHNTTFKIFVGYCYNLVAARTRSPTESIALTLKSARLRWPVDARRRILERLYKKYTWQSQYTAQEIADELKRIKSLIPSSVPQKRLTATIRLFENASSWEETSESFLSDDLEKIYFYLKENRIPLILMEYPSIYTIANRSIQKIAQKHDIPLVKNYKTFQKLIDQHHGNTSDLFMDDSHCTPLGHQIMAKNAAKLILNTKALGLNNLPLTKKSQGIKTNEPL